MVKALLIMYPDKFVIEECVALAESAGYEPAAMLTQRYLSRSKFGIGEGKAEEASRMVRELNIEKIVFDAKLKASQAYNLAKVCKTEVIDREKLILEIFAKRAHTAESKLQVELAELTYQLPRARDMVRMAKMGEQPGFFGLGKYEVEIYVRMIKRRISTLKKKVEEIRKRREVLRARREKIGLPSVAITGYTGSGKTTLFNLLSSEKKEVNAGVFTTLSTTTRGIIVDGTKFLISDTVGFLSRLPHYMIEAFHSTLEEVSLSNLVLLLLDSSLPEDMLLKNFETCIETLQELGVPQDKILNVINKVDVSGKGQAIEKSKMLGLKNPILISAKEGFGIERLLEEIKMRLSV
jgi:GTP-binding protein HflX